MLVGELVEKLNKYHQMSHLSFYVTVPNDSSDPNDWNQESIMFDCVTPPAVGQIALSLSSTRIGIEFSMEI